ncbi:MAG TPA: IS1595 family transposase [Candidatus Limnocylindria bacterium]|nr:IS1595 family transposase [Candidatus Limnocylindria bacterium]
MAPRQRTARPKQARYTRKDFDRDFRDDAACLDWLVSVNYPDGIVCASAECGGKVRKHYKVAGRAAYACDMCGHHVYPMAGTIYEKSSTPLRTWFLAVYLISTTKTGVSSRWLQREIGVTYKTAWRMFKQIRSMLDEGKPTLGGKGVRVEIDETYVGGRVRGHVNALDNKSVVFGVHERGGRMYAEVVPDVKRRTLTPLIKNYVIEGSTIYTDELLTYRMLRNAGYPEHVAVNHKRDVFVVGEAHVNNVESFWGNFKRGVDGAHHRLSPKYLQSYVDEWTFRFNHRKDEMPMFWTMLRQVSA